MTIKEREFLISNMVENNAIDKKDIEGCRFLAGIFAKGTDYEKVIKWTKTEETKAKIWWKRLIRGGYIKGDKICVEEEFWDNDFSFFLMLNCMYGHLKRSEE